jgi:hypothetical protein
MIWEGAWFNLKYYFSTGYETFILQKVSLLELRSPVIFSMHSIQKKLAEPIMKLEVTLVITA